MVSRAKYWHIRYQIEALRKANPTPLESVQSEFRRAANRHWKFAAEKSKLTHLVEPSQIESLIESHRVKAAEVADRAAETVDQISPNFQILIKFGDMANGVASFQVPTLNNSNYDN